MNTVMLDKPIITKDKIVKSSQAAKQFGTIKKRAKDEPLFISDNGNIDTVLVGYDYFEKMYKRLMELEEKEGQRILLERVSDIEENPASTVSWRDVRRSR
ncbi:type II toxin-antitoxin system Phd/YefM family antitoxin [Clostridium botulinum]|uniref:type II toxin-antitoxin system Phd/YefM family antitoxin n=1 Tax=Clostridium botulinum TaxID=1491 RepID=UPI0004DAFC53|nr:type II toxin-antitoxin system Phd/YefM family antitoxin [Clostridium botulinum]KEH90379.1 hypothetical protein Z963_p0077 [Clostridium botulinum C/D str. It1]